MLGINHTTTGILIALSVNDPILAAPLALASHFALDMIPHHGNDPRYDRGTKGFHPKVALDGIMSGVVYLAAILAWPAHSLVISLCVFLALLPDFLWPLALYVKQRGPLWAFFKFHKSIQRSETPQGIIIEYIWAAATGLALLLVPR